MDTLALYNMRAKTKIQTWSVVIRRRLTTYNGSAEAILSSRLDRVKGHYY